MCLALPAEVVSIDRANEAAVVGFSKDVLVQVRPRLCALLSCSPCGLRASMKF